jgi:membrane protein
MKQRNYGRRHLFGGKTVDQALTFPKLKSMALRAWGDFWEDQAPRLGAALAYYTALSMAPLLILIIAVAGLAFGKEAAQGQLFTELRNMIGPEGAKMIEELVQNASKPASGILASIIGIATLIFGASSVATELRTSLNTIWDRPQDPNDGIKEMITERSYALVVVLGCGFLLLVSLAVSSMVAGAGKWFSSLLPLPQALLQGFNILLSIAVLTGVFAVLFKYLPDVRVKWKDVLLGAAVTAVLFTIGKFLIGVYLGQASFGSTYGAAGSLVVVLVWVYYSSQIFFLGAEFTQVYACEHGSDPLCTRRRRQEAGEGKIMSKAQAFPKPRPSGTGAEAPSTPASGHEASAAGGNVLNAAAGPPGKTVGWAGTLLGVFLVGNKVRNSIKK